MSEWSLKNCQWVVWGLIHLCLALSLPFLLSVLFGCSDDDAGNESQPVSMEEVQSTMNRMTKGISPHSVSAGESAAWITTSKIESNPQEILVSESFEQVLQTKNNCEKEFQVHYYRWQKNHQGEDKQPVELEGTEFFAPKPCSESGDDQEDPAEDDGAGQDEVKPRDSLEIVGRQSFAEPLVWLFTTSPIEKWSPLTPLSKWVTASNAVVDVTFHDLSYREFKMEPPVAVRERPDCEQVPGCELRVREMSVYIHRIDAGGNKEITLMEEQVSPDTPYWAQSVLSCASQQPEMNGRSVFIRQCRQLVDFSYEALE